MLGWCLQFTTPMYLASCCCYLGKLQTVQKALCFRGTVNSHLGMSPFFLLWVKFCLGCGCKELRSMLCDAKPESWGASFAGVWPKFGTNSAKLMLMLGCFRMMLHNMSQRRWGVSSEWLLHKCTSFFSALICNFYWKSLAFSPRSWRVMSLPRAGFSAQVLWTPRHQRKVYLAHCKGRSGSLAKPRLPHGSPDARIRTAHGWQKYLNESMSVNFPVCLSQAAVSFLFFCSPHQPKWDISALVCSAKTPFIFFSNRRISSVKNNLVKACTGLEKCANIKQIFLLKSLYPMQGQSVQFAHSRKDK